MAEVEEYQTFHDGHIVYLQQDGWSIEKYTSSDDIALYHNCNSIEKDGVVDPYGRCVTYKEEGGWTCDACEKQVDEEMVAFFKILGGKKDD